MKNPRLNTSLSRVALSLTVASLLAAGCSTSTTVSGSYQTPKGAVSGSVGISTNGVDLSGSYATTNQTVSGALNLQK